MQVNVIRHFRGIFSYISCIDGNKSDEVFTLQSTFGFVEISPVKKYTRYGVLLVIPYKVKAPEFMHGMYNYGDACKPINWL